MLDSEVDRKEKVMEFSDIFRYRRKKLNKIVSARRNRNSDEIIECKKCHGKFKKATLQRNYYVCPDCNDYFRMTPTERIRMIADEKSFKEHLRGLQSVNPIDFPDYEEKLEDAKKTSNREEAVLTGIMKINHITCGVGVLDANYMMGSMGTVVGERITAITEFCERQNLPLIIFSASGGARMQEGMFSLMQMAKTTAAIEKFQRNGGLYISCYTNPTTGGVSASFAALGDILIAEPDALICFAGPRVIEQTIGEKLPEGFQHSEFLLKSGILDMVVTRHEMREVLTRLLQLHGYEEKHYERNSY